MLIQDVERKTGLDRATIRFYEKEKFITPQREDNGYRSYCENDLQTLLKIKLLRQLGMSLIKIKSLQQGNGDFSAVLSEQIAILEQQIREDTLSVLVCRKMLDDGAEFKNLDSVYYLNMLSTPSWLYSEPVQTESHPWRRYFARHLDVQIILCCLQLLLVVIIRIRPFGEGALKILGYASGFVAVPILAAFLHYFGTTPGKWMMGIRLESIHGGKLSGGEALNREGKVIWHGLGLFVPILQQWKMYRGYRSESDGAVQPWNEDTEIIYTQWTTIKKTVAIITAVIIILSSVYVGTDVVMPTYKSRRITVSEFAENYNDYEKLHWGQGEYVLGDDGTWKPRGYTQGNQLIVNIPFEENRPDFVYDIHENGDIKCIYYENSWENIDFQDILPYYCQYAVEIMVASRPGSSFRDVISIQKQLDEKLYATLPLHDGAGEGQVTVRDVTVSWKTQIENCGFVQDGVMFAQDDEIMSFDIQLWIAINQ